MDGTPSTENGVATYAPRASGVYGIYNNNQWIYVGEAQDMEARLYAHLRGESDQSPCILHRNPSFFILERCDEATRKVRERTLILELRPACNQT